jgi:methionyl-tRNA formyltransferase
MSLKVVFMGTPGFAVTTLAAILGSKHKIVGVVTAVDKPAGRGKKISASAVKDYAVAQQLPLLQPSSLKDPTFISDLQALKADVFVVVAFRMLPKVVWSIPQKGTFNLHASILPAYRGAAPINWAIINQEKESGVTTFLVDEKIDTGNVLLQEKIQLENGETASSLHDKLASLGGKVTIGTLEALENGIEAQPQLTDGTEKDAPKLTKENTRIDWSKSLDEIEAHINGLSPYPVAWTELCENEKTARLKIYSVKTELCSHDYPQQSIVIENKQMKVAHSQGFMICESIQMPNKRRMEVKDLLNGYSFDAMARLK